MAAKKKTLGVLLAITAAIAPSIALAGLNTAPTISARYQEAASVPPRALHAIAPGDDAANPKTRVRGFAVADDDSIGIDHVVSHGLHLEKPILLRRIASRSPLVPGGAGFGAGPAGVGGGVFQQGPGVYQVGGYTGLENGGGFSGVSQTLLFQDHFIESTFIQADFMLGAGGMIRAPALLWKSGKLFGHAFSRHGEGWKVLRSLFDRARNTGTPQGQWLNNEGAAELIKDLVPQLQGPASMRIPQGLGQVVMPDGSVVEATGAILVPNGVGGLKTAFPIVW